uniref:THAP domain containing, apoptosis associated protein 2 n=1 Tax=Mus musculus TaxID=10090 RepID=A0A1X7SB55_MOUSE
MRGPGKCRPIAPRRAVLLPTTSTLTSASTETQVKESSEDKQQFSSNWTM